MMMLACVCTGIFIQQTIITHTAHGGSMPPAKIAADMGELLAMDNMNNTGNILNKTDKCATDPCRNGATCQDLFIIYTCHCNVHSTGLNCEECLPGYIGLNCSTRKISCSQDPCVNGGNCESIADSGFRCHCLAEYGGKYCELETKCTNSPCLHGATCEWQTFYYKCLCDEGYTGEHCETDLFYTRDMITTNMEACEPKRNDRFVCRCSEGFTGPYCQLNMDDCVNDPCQNGAACIGSTNSFMCMCHPGYYGDECSKLCPSGTYGENCAFRCHCFKNMTCNATTGKCPGMRCDETYTGPGCSELLDTSYAERLVKEETVYRVAITLGVIGGTLILVGVGYYIRRRAKLWADKMKTPLVEKPEEPPKRKRGKKISPASMDSLTSSSSASTENADGPDPKEAESQSSSTLSDPQDTAIDFERTSSEFTDP